MKTIILLTICILIYLGINIKVTNIGMPDQNAINAAKDKEDFLNKIKMIESSGGQNTDHKVLDSGIHQGTAAIGQYGLMPSTIREIAQRLKNRDEKLSLAPDFAGDPEIEKYTEPTISDTDLANQYNANPALQEKTANYLKALLNTRYNGDLDKMAYGWSNGHNTPTEKIDSTKLESSPYVAKFRKLKETFSQPLVPVSITKLDK